MKVLFIGGTGNISSACSRLALQQGMDLYHMNRGHKSSTLTQQELQHITRLQADVRDPDSVRDALGNLSFDVVVNWIAFTPEHVRQDINIFGGRVGQYIFISSASAYEKPMKSPFITESTPVFNPFWEYSQNKADAERVLTDAYQQQGFPATIVRPSHTYSDGWFPSVFGAHDFTVPQRILDGRQLVVHGDGTSLWVLTHADDFARGFNGLLGHPAAIGESIHITSDELLSWNQIYGTIAAALGAEAQLVHMPSRFIADCDPDIGAGLLGDKSYSVIFDNSKIKRLVPGFVARIPFHEGVRRSIRYVEQNPSARTISDESNAKIDELLAAWKRAAG